MNSDIFHKNDIRGFGQTSDRGTSVKIEPARILSVNRDAWTVNAQPEGDQRIITDVPILSWYEHIDGSGGYFLPKRGAQGLLVYYDRGGPRFWAFRSEAIGENSYKGNKFDLNEGDMIFRSSYGSHLLMRDTGIIQQYVNPALSMALLGYTNTIFMRGERMDISMVGGRWRWIHDRNRGGGILNPGSKTPISTLIETYKELSRKGNILQIAKGYHEDRSAYSIDYNEGNDSRVIWKIGKINEPDDGLDLDIRDQVIDQATGSNQISDPGDDRLILDIDNGSYRREIGERDDGTVSRTTITGRGTSNRSWTKTTKVGKQNNGHIVEDRVESGLSSVDTKIKEDGQIDLSVNEGNMSLTIDTNGNTTIEIKNESEFRIICGTDGIRFGSLDASQQAILGNLFQTYLNTMVIPHLESWLKSHTAIGNLGSPTATPLQAGTLNIPTMSDDNLSTKVRIEEV